MCIYVLWLPNGSIAMKRQTFGKGTQVYSYECSIFAVKIATLVTTSVYIKYISGFKII